MKKCPYCGEENQDEELQCWNCGEWFDILSPPKKEQSGPDFIDGKTKLQKIRNKYWISIGLIIIIIAGLLFTISQMTNFNKGAEKLTVIEPPKAKTPSAPAPKPVPEPAPAPEQSPAPATATIAYNSTTETQAIQAVQAEKTYKDKIISIDFQDEDIKSALHLMAQYADVNIVVGDDLKGTITLSMKNVPWEQALDTILETFGLSQKQMDDKMILISYKQ